MSVDVEEEQEHVDAVRRNGRVVLVRIILRRRVAMVILSWILTSSDFDLLLIIKLHSVDDQSIDTFFGVLDQAKSLSLF